ncbi:hypothetical protein IFM89_001958 [Coptis chinensis]|uniref:CS domain-containing protein n=1 Tax=Coptis chinensis TaxID=261450 RepID=A0A835LTA1_9MAGN|nr:hypothetical protein IFM89_001958 [Coptis chinensis]
MSKLVSKETHLTSMQHDLTSHVKTDSSFWTIEDDILHITLQKRDKGQTWASPILGQGQLDPYASHLEQKRLMLQRFQEEVTLSFSLKNALLQLSVAGCY